MFYPSSGSSLDPACRISACVKKDSPSKIVESVARIEACADQCFHSLKILQESPDTALWALLIGGIHLVEREIDARGENTPQLDATLINTSSLVSTAMRWVVKNAGSKATVGRRKWTLDLAGRVTEAITVAHNYNGFLNALPMWHQNRYGVELLSPTRARFTAIGSDTDRRVSAYQKGFRPKAGRNRSERPQKLRPTAKVARLFEKVYSACRPVGPLGFQYEDPWDLWLELLPEYQSRLTAVTRRDGTLSLGDYVLADFKKFYAALLALCATQEHLCFAWGRNTGAYPNESVVMVRSIDEWAEVLSKLSGISQTLSCSIIKDLTFDFSISPNLHVCPFIPLLPSRSQLALAPHFPLHSRADENILWVCSKLRPTQFDSTSLTKEFEMYTPLATACSQYSPQGPISLPQPIPDIDLLLADESSSTAVIAELKWIRKPTKLLERLDRDKDVLKGLNQLRRIHDFLEQNPHHLVSIGKLVKPLNEYEKVHYTVIARDHWVWAPPDAQKSIVTYDAFTASIIQTSSLANTMRDLLTYDWLPIEGRDYTIRYDRSYANGVEIETETFYAL